jgi:hypothetical protein
MTRTEIIAQLDAELSRLESARDFLTAALKDSKNGLLKPGLITKITMKHPARPRKRQTPAMASPPVSDVAAAVAPPNVQAPLPVEHAISRIPPRRRMGPRQFQTDKKSSAALSGLVPAGPVAVSAVEARKVQERVVAAPPTPKVAELRTETGSERSLSSLIQAFERRTGLSGIEIP